MSGEPAFGHFPFATPGQAVRQGVHLQQTPATRLPSVVGVQDLAGQAFAQDQRKIRCVFCSWKDIKNEYSNR